MTIHYQTRGFVFKKEDVNESDRNFSIFTEDYGRIDIFAKAIRKSVSKLRSGIDIFSMSDIEFIQGKSRKTLTDAQVVAGSTNLSKNLPKFKIANDVGELLDSFLRGQEKDERIFNLINETFTKLDNCTSFEPEGSQGLNGSTAKPYTLICYFFLWNFLSLLGYHPEVQKCASCHEKLIPYDLYFSSKDGGIICKKCSDQKEDALKVNSDAVKILRLILKKDWQTLSRLKIEPTSQKLFEKISENYYLYNSFKNN